MATDRYGVSNRATATLIDFGLITPQDQSLVTDNNKVARARQKYRNQIQHKEMVEVIDVTGIFSIQLLNLVTESISLHQYMPISKNGLKRQILLVGCDGRNVNVRWKNGSIVNLERMFGRELQWAVSLLHTNELPLRHLFEYFDGKTSGPNSLSGPISKSLKNKLSKIPVVEFEPIIYNEFPEMTEELIDDLSTDQSYLYRICQACLRGNCTEDLELLEPGPICHSRWLTLACRIAHVYMSTIKPFYEL
ncbi:hypothetical protein LOD99_3912 [Oopsacas minuta]|uniref:Uncharacterized protein n=1 Tax=Oopsacas minuta TaxID=111878 RepID=A0AAV7JVY5_9METZ|nr:hypothetical protein LOD99_3912 [Oopsacas minuta]